MRSMGGLHVVTVVMLAAACGEELDQAQTSGASGETADPEALMIPDNIVCATCAIEVEELLRLEDSPVAPIPTMPSEVVEDGAGRFWLVFNNDIPLVYGSDGIFLQQLGPRGEGPEEYLHPTTVHPLPGDSVLVFERSRSVFYVLRPDLSQARVILPTHWSGGVTVAALDWPESVTMTSVFPAEPGTDHSFGVVDMSGPEAISIRSFGSQIDPRSGMVAFIRMMAPARVDELWAWYWYPYRVERWTREGRRTATIIREASWFSSDRMRARQEWFGGGLPTPQLRSVREDAAGRLWVFIDVGRDTWREGFPPIPPGGGPMEISDSDVAYERMYQTQVEVLDPIGGRVIASTKLDDWVVSALADGRAAIYATDAAGIPFVRIVRLTLSQ